MRVAAQAISRLKGLAGMLLGLLVEVKVSQGIVFFTNKAKALVQGALKMGIVKHAAFGLAVSRSSKARIPWRSQVSITSWRRSGE